MLAIKWLYRREQARTRGIVLVIILLLLPPQKDFAMNASIVFSITCVLGYLLDKPHPLIITLCFTISPSQQHAWLSVSITALHDNIIMYLQLPIT